MILSPHYHKYLSHPKVNPANPILEEIFVTSLMHGKVMAFDHLIDKSNKEIKKMLAEDLLEILPDDYLKNSYLNNVKVLELFADNVDRNRGIDEVARNLPIHLLDSPQKLEDGINDILEDISLENSMSSLHFLSFLNNTKCFKDFVLNFRRTNTRVKSQVYDDFELFKVPYQFLNTLLSCLPTQPEYYEREEIGPLLNTLKKDAVGFLSMSDPNYDLEPLVGNYRPQRYFEQFIDLLEAKIHLDASFEYSRKNATPIKFSFSQTNVQSVFRFPQNHIEPMELQREYYRKIYRLVLENINIPKVNTLDDVIKLRKHPNIIEFKKRMGEWNRALMENEFKELEALKRYLIKANEAMTHCNIRSQRSRFWFIEVGLECTELIYSVAHKNLLGGFLAGYSLVEKAKTEYYKKEYKWLMLN